MKAYTIALATRLKRRIFNAGNIPLDVIGLIRDVLKERGLALSGYKFYDYGVVLCLECTDQEEAAKVSEVIRKATSRPIRQKYPELWKMPSLWNQSPCIVEGEMDSENMKMIEDYYRRLKTR